MNPTRKQLSLNRAASKKQIPINNDLKRQIAKLRKRQPTLRVYINASAGQDEPQGTKVTFQSQLSETKHRSLFAKILAAADTPEAAFNAAVGLVKRSPGHQSQVILGLVANHIGRSKDGGQLLTKLITNDLLKTVRGK